MTTALGGFNINAGAGTVTQASGSNLNTSTFSQAGGVWTGSTSFTVTLSSNFSKTGGTFTGSATRIVFTGAGASYTSNSKIVFYSAKFSADTTISNDIEPQLTTVDANVVVSIDLGMTFSPRIYSGGTYSNSGTIQGTGTLDFQIFNENETITLGTVNCPTVMRLLATAGASYAVNLGANTSLGSTLSVSSEHAANTLTLSHNNNYTLSVTGLTTLGNRGILTHGTGAWSLSGGLTMNGTGSVINQGGSTFTVGGAFNQSNGTINLANGQSFIVDGANFTHSAGTITSPGAGQGTLLLQFTSADRTISLSTLTNINVTVEAGAASSGSRTCTWGANTTVPAAFLVDSAHASNTMTVDADVANNRTLSCTNHTVGTGGVYLARAAAITPSGNWDTSLGTFTRGTSLVTLSGAGKTIKMNATAACTDGFYDITIAGGASYTLASNMYYWHTLTKTGTLNDDIYAEISCPAGAWKQLILTVEPPVGAGYKQVAFVSEPPTSTAWNKVKQTGD